MVRVDPLTAFLSNNQTTTRIHTKTLFIILSVAITLIWLSDCDSDFQGTIINLKTHIQMRIQEFFPRGSLF
ncbi:hypothetical protein HanIR_Chr13g0669881 [Helianthus annuus]|nr:hypothetical protein HanIR_Chr13g0669881 [Helianthus annuus]